MSLVPHTNPLQPLRRKLHARIARATAHVSAFMLVAVAGIVLLLAVGATWYTGTADFQARAAKRVAALLADSTGGRVEIGHLRFDLWRLALEVDGLVVHGLEPGSEPPYLSAGRIFVRLKLNNLLAHVLGAGSGSPVGLNLLRVERPSVHLIVGPDGTTNQPIPKHRAAPGKPVMETLLDLEAQQVEVVDGVALLNDRVIPFNLAARGLAAEIRYVAALGATPERYAATLDLSDLRTQMQAEPQAQSHLHLEATVGRDTAAVTQFNLHTGTASDLIGSASLTHFASPVWQMTARGRLELRQIQTVLAVDGLEAGTLDLDLAGRSCAPATAPPPAAQRSPFWSLRHPRPPGPGPAASDPDCVSGYLFTGSGKIEHGAYRNPAVRFHDIDGSGRIHITPAESLFAGLTATLPGGGRAAGDLRIVGVHSSVVATVDRIPLRTIMDTTAPVGYGDLGFDTAIAGPVKVEWNNARPDPSDSVLVDADLALAPTGGTRKGSVNNVPVAGRIVGHYDGKREAVDLLQLDLHSPQSTLAAHGVLGVNLGDPLTALQADLNVRDLNEFDQLLRTLGLQGAFGTRGRAAIPAVLHGSAQFHGTATGGIARIDVKGHLQADRFEFRLDVPPPPPAPKRTSLLAKLMGKPAPAQPAPGATTLCDVAIDSLVAEGDYTPFGLSLASATIQRGAAVLNLAGTFKPRTVLSHRVASYAWDEGSTVDATVRVANAPLADLLQIAGLRERVPATGTLDASAHAAGALADLTGTGNVALRNGVAFGQPYESASADLAVRGKAIEATGVGVTIHGMRLAGDGGYDFRSERLHGRLQADNLRLSKFALFQQSLPDADADGSFVATASGTPQQPGIQATLNLASIAVQGKPLGDAVVEAHSDRDILVYTLRSKLAGAGIAASGQTQLSGDLDTQARMSFTGFDVAAPLALFAAGGIAARSNISGTVAVHGPARTPSRLSGSAEFDRFEVTAQNVTLKSAEPLRIGLRDGLAVLDQVHIVGTDTDLRAGGSVQWFSPVDARPGTADGRTGKAAVNVGKLDLHAAGSVSMALAHGFDPSLIASGKVLFSVAANGTTANPALTGNVQVQNVNLAIDGVPNGLSNVKGSLVFNEDRLNVENLVATTGGGQLKIGGFLTYRNGFYADLTATGDAVRVRYLGLSSTANANLRLQGGPRNSLLSGNVLITRFGVGADVDFAAFAGAGGVNAAPDPAAAANNIGLDVHVASSPQLDFQNSYAKLAGTVDLTVRGTIADPTILGRIQITDGSATFAGTRYELERGDVYFNNPVRIDPTIDLDATAHVENYDVSVGLHGTANSLKPTYRSEPPLSEADIFNLLALGRTSDEAQIYQEQQVQQGADPTTSALLGGALNSTVGNRVSKLFGVSSVKIDPAFVGTLGNSSARITVQQQLSRQITLTYATNINYSSQQLISAQYQLTPNTAIVATRDESGVYSVVFKIRHRYR